MRLSTSCVTTIPLQVRDQRKMARTLKSWAAKDTGFEGFWSEFESGIIGYPSKSVKYCRGHDTVAGIIRFASQFHAALLHKTTQQSVHGCQDLLVAVKLERPIFTNHPQAGVLDVPRY